MTLKNWKETHKKEEFTQWNHKSESVNVIVQRTGSTWFVFRSERGERGAVQTIGQSKKRTIAEAIAKRYMRSHPHA